MLVKIHFLLPKNKFYDFPSISLSSNSLFALSKLRAYVSLAFDCHWEAHVLVQAGELACLWKLLGLKLALKTSHKFGESGPEKWRTACLKNIRETSQVLSQPKKLHQKLETQKQISREDIQKLKTRKKQHEEIFF